MRTPKILQTISTLHILTAFCITETRIDILLQLGDRSSVKNIQSMVILTLKLILLLFKLLSRGNIQ